MKILVVGGDGRIASRLIPKLEGDIHVTTRREDKNRIYYDLSKSDFFIGDFDCVILCACDFKRGRSDEEQSKFWNTNVTGVTNLLRNVLTKHTVFLSSYLSDSDTAYGRQKKAVEDWIKKDTACYTIFRVGKLESEEDYQRVTYKIAQCVKDKEFGTIE